MDPIVEQFQGDHRQSHAEQHDQPHAVVGDLAGDNADGEHHGGLGAQRGVGERDPRVQAHLGAGLALANSVNAVKDGWNGFNVVHFSAARMGALMLGYAQPGGIRDIIAARPWLNPARFTPPGSATPLRLVNLRTLGFRLPLWNEDGTLAGFKHLDLWNFAFDRQAGIWYWNADASRAAMASGSPISERKMISTAPLEPITAISAVGQA